MALRTYINKKWKNEVTELNLQIRKLEKSQQGNTKESTGRKLQR